MLELDLALTPRTKLRRPSAGGEVLEIDTNESAVRPVLGMGNILRFDPNSVPDNRIVASTT